MDSHAASMQLLELSAAQIASSDLDYAFQLQLEEAVSASLRNLPPNAASSRSQAVPRPSQEENDNFQGDESLLVQLQALEFQNSVQEEVDREIAEKEAKNLNAELRRLSHDAAFAKNIESMPDDDWDSFGDDFEDPFEEKVDNRKRFKLYYKGLVSLEDIGQRSVTLAAAGIAIYDSNDRLLLRMSKPLGNDISRAVASYSALIEGLIAARQLGIRNITAYGDCLQVYNQVIGRWSIRQRKLVKFHNDVIFQMQKLDNLFMVLIPRCENLLVSKLARQGIENQLSIEAEQVQKREKKHTENCSICLEDTEINKIHEVNPCKHRYCFSCMAQHVKVKLSYGSLPECPYDGCCSKLTAVECRNFLPSTWIELLTKRIVESSIPDSDKVYCPYPKCSTLMRRSELDKKGEASSSSSPLLSNKNRANCKECHRPFCIECRAPWHHNLSCREYQRRLPTYQGVDAKLHTLALREKWRRCRKCKHMIELMEGCNHMTCRCGFEFCYVCGAEWKNKKATCQCPLWDLHNILREPIDDDFDDDDYDDNDDCYDSEDDNLLF